MPPGCCEGWPTRGNWEDTTRRALSHTHARWTQNTNVGAQERRYVVLCEEEVPIGELNALNDPEGMIRAFHEPSAANLDKWNQPHRFWDGFELFDKETPRRKGGT